MDGEITEADKISLLREFTARQAEVEAGRVSWSWSEGVALFPEAICPFCQVAMISNRIWWIKERMLLGQWKLKDGKLQKEMILKHPHVSGTDICMGTGRSELAAMFLSMNPNDNYWGNDRDRWNRWLWTAFDHQCAGDSTSRRCTQSTTCACNRHRQARGEVRCDECGSWKAPEVACAECAQVARPVRCRHACCNICCTANGCPGIPR